MSGEMSKPRRIQSPFITEAEVKKVVKFLKKNYVGDILDEIELSTQEGGVSLTEEDLDAEEEKDNEDPLYEDARDLVIRSKRASTSFLQRKLGLGYGRAAKIMDMLEDRGVIAPSDGTNKPREVLVDMPDQTDDADEDYDEEEEKET